MSGSAVVLQCEKGGTSFDVTADSFSSINFEGVTVDGVKYYVEKAVKLGAKSKAKKKKKKVS